MKYSKYILSLCLLLILVSCAPEETAAVASSDFTVVATFYPVYLAAANITNDIEGVTLSLLTPPDTGCLHDYQLSPGELESIKGADLVLSNGEVFLPRIRQTYPELTVFDYGNGEEEHNWVYVEDYIRMVNHIGNAIINADPDRADNYEQNIRVYLEDLAQLAEEMRTTLMNLSDSPVIMFHEGFDSWSTAYGLNIAATFELEQGTEPTPRELADTIALVSEMGVKALFTEPQYSGSAAQTVARETGARVYTLDPVATGMTTDLGYYQKVMRANVETLRAALGEE